MRVAQADGRAGEEVFLYGSGSIVHGFTAELRPLEGFPLSGGRAPDFVDLNGDSRPELVSGGFDDTIYVYSFR
jgi:hypothetical protein